MTWRGALALTDTQDDEGCVFPAGQQQEVDRVVGDETEAQDHGTPLLETLACGEGRGGLREAQAAGASTAALDCAKHPFHRRHHWPRKRAFAEAGHSTCCMPMRLGLQVPIL